MATAEKTTQNDERLLNRELSWLAFNGRVLELALATGSAAEGEHVGA